MLRHSARLRAIELVASIAVSQPPLHPDERGSAFIPTSTALLGAQQPGDGLSFPISKTSEKKMRAHLTADAARQHERQFGWKNFRVLTITTDHDRMQSMTEALPQLRVPHSPEPSLFLF